MLVPGTHGGSSMFQRVSGWLLCGLAIGAMVLAVPRAGATDVDPLRDVRATWEQAMLAGDAEAAAALFAEQAVQMRPGRATHRGRAAIAAGYAEDFDDAAVTAVSMSPSATRVEGTRALEFGTFTISWSERPAEGPPLVLHGRYLLWASRSPAGKWQIDFEMHTIEPEVPEAQLR